MLRTLREAASLTDSPAPAAFWWARYGLLLFFMYATKNVLIGDPLAVILMAPIFGTGIALALFRYAPREARLRRLRMAEDEPPLLDAPTGPQ